MRATSAWLLKPEAGAGDGYAVGLTGKALGMPILKRLFFVKIDLTIVYAPKSQMANMRT